MADQPKPPETRSWTLRIATAVAIGLAGSVVIWVATPYNNFILDTGYISDSYLPVTALFLMLLLVLVVNPLLLKFRPGLMLDKRQLAMVMSIMLMASVVPGQGLMRMLPYGIAGTNWSLTQNRRLCDGYEQVKGPSWLFPDQTGYGKEAPAAYGFLQKLGPNEPIPWRAWLRPAASWGGLVFFAFAMMMGLAMIVLPQWQRNERLAFPLLSVEQSLIESPEEGRLVASLFRSKGFWIAAALVFLLQAARGLNIYLPESVPAIPLNWNIENLFTEGALLYVPLSIKQGQIYFVLVGIAFFMPNRTGFSIWFFQLAYAVYRIIFEGYAPPYHPATVEDHRTGAMLALSAGILWLGRHHWGRVARSMVLRAPGDEERFFRAGGTTFLVGCAGIFAWLVWVNVQPLVALGFVAIAFMVALLISRLVAETGMPFIRLHSAYAEGLIRLAPVSWFSAATVFFSGVIGMLFQIGSRVSAAAMGTHALALDDEASPRYRTRVAWLLLGVLMAGVLLSGAVHLVINYRHNVTLMGESPINPWGINILQDSGNVLQEWMAGKFNVRPYGQLWHIGFGGLLAGALQWACLALPRWPIHPIGLLIVNTFYMEIAWASVLIGWLLKTLIIHYGGARLYRNAVPFFMGLILGEVFAAILWSIVPAVLASLGMEFLRVQVQPM